MLKLQIFLVLILIACVVFVSCDRTQKILKPVAEDMMPAEEITPAEEMMGMMDMTAHRSWSHVMLPAPGPAEEATSPAETGGVHGLGTRTVYINDIGIMANTEGAAYSAGTVIVKEIMDDANTFVAKVATMTKTGRPDVCCSRWLDVCQICAYVSRW